MLSEELHVIGILDENKASGSIKAEDLRALICDYLQLAPYHPVLIEVLTQNNVSLEGQAKVDIHDIFRATNTSYFNQNVPSVNEILEKIVLMMSEIRDGASAHKMKEFENLSVGVACNVQTVHSILWVIRKTINNALLEKWISAHSGVLDQPGLLMAHEFIYLLCNCMSKTEMMDKIPKIPMNPKMDKKTHLFKIDKDFGKTYETPDHKIQHIMSTYYNVDKAYIEGIATKAVVTEKITKKTHRHQPSKNEPNQDDEENLRKQLRGMVMTVGIKVKLKEYHQKLIRSRLNGKSAFDKLIAQAHGQNTLPSPLDLHSQGNLTAGNNLSPKKIWGIPNRPQTAQMFHNKSLSSPFQLNLNTPIKSDRNLQKFLETDSIKGFNSVSANRVPALNTNLPKTPVGRSSRGSINPAILKNMNPRKSSELLSQGLGYQEPEIIPPMERAIDEEFEKFQSQNKSGLKPKAPRRQTYFNSAINPSAARIYSSRPESPQIQASPLASKFFL